MILLILLLHHFKTRLTDEAKEAETRGNPRINLNFITMKTLKAIQYTERCIAVIGDTKPLKEQLKQAGGKFNPYLKVNGSIVAGWVFSVNRKDQIVGIIEGVTIEAQTIEVKPEQKPIEPMKATREKQPEFKMLVKLSGFIEMERIFTNEAKMLKELAEIRKSYNKQVVSVDAPGLNERTYSGQSLVRFGYKGKENFHLADHQKYMEEKGIAPLKVQFINLL